MRDELRKSKLDGICSWLDGNLLITALRRGLILAIPFFLIGSLSLVVANFPIPAYQTFIRTFADGFLLTTVHWVYFGTMGVLSLILIATISYSYAHLADPVNVGLYPTCCLVSYVVFTIEDVSNLQLSIFDSTWLFTAMLVTLGCCSLLRLLLRISHRWHDKHYHEGIDLDFQSIVTSLLPIAACVLVFLFLKVLLITVTGSSSLQNIGSVLATDLFEKVGTGAGGAVLFIFLIHFLWFFGIHGSNLLSMVSDGMFESGMAANIAAVAAGGAPQTLFTKTFFDCFILMGGSGATICLLLALLIGTKRGNSKRLFRLSIIPSLFNVNELVLFGLPVVFNPIMLIPFILVPLVMLGTSAGAMALGLVPFCSQTVQWTTPVLFSGWLSTGSWTGAALQAVNIAIGTALYLPFIRLSEKYYSGLLKRNISTLKNEIVQREAAGDVTSLNGTAYRDLHEVIKLLTADLRHSLSNSKISLYYQPQFRSDGTLYGVEALLRWNHPSAGFLYPPLVVELAREEGLLGQMGYQIIETAARALQRLAKESRYPIHLAVNISPLQLEDPLFCDKVKDILNRYDFKDCLLCFEITEQIALSSTPAIQSRIQELRMLGVPFHMDDFGMGHSSMIYLQNNEFAAVKLDGRLIRDMVNNKRSQEIISSIQRMSHSLNYDLIAEYVETEEQQKTLETLGCHIYQGYLYSAALPLPELESYLHQKDALSHILPQAPTQEELYL